MTSAVHLRDTSNQGAADDTLARLHRKAALLDASRDAVYVRDLDGKILEWNHSAESLYGWTASEVIGETAQQFLYADTARYASSTIQTLEAGVWNGDVEQFTKSGVTITAESRWQLYRDEELGTTSILCLVTSVVEDMSAQETRYRNERLRSLGTLAGGIAHDLNNVFTPILMSTQLLSADEDDRDRLELLHAIELSVRRGTDMIDQVLSFASGKIPHPVLVDTAQLLEELVAFCRNVLPATIRLEVSTESPLPQVTADATQVLQVLMNLVTNARDAMPDGGRLHIRSRTIPAAMEGQPASIEIEIEDDGIGMDATTATQIFDPFFTTKPVGRGTGLGLSTSFAIARVHGGDLEVHTEPGAGSRFILTLPVPAREVSSADPRDHDEARTTLDRGSSALPAADASTDTAGDRQGGRGRDHGR